MATKILFINLNNKVVGSTVVLSDNLTVDHTTVYADDKEIMKYNGFVFPLIATEEEINNEILKNNREMSFFGNEIFGDPINEKPNEDLASYNISVQDVVEYNRGILIKKFSNECNAEILNGFYSESTQNYFAFDDKAQTNFNQTLTLILLNDWKNVPEKMIKWKTEDNGIKDFTIPQFLQISSDAEKHKQSNIGFYWQKKTMIESTFNTLSQLAQLKNVSLYEL